MTLPRLIARWFSQERRRAASPPPPALPYTRLTLSDWQSSPERVAYVAELLRAPLFLDLLGMLANIRPVPPEALDATSAAVLLGQRTGHDQVIASLLAAGTQRPAPPREITADYAPENVMRAWEGEREADA